MRILALTNLYPNPYQPYRATFNRQQIKALAVHHAVEIIAPIPWTEERAARKRSDNSLPADRRVRCDDLQVSHPRYYYTPKVLRTWYGWFFLLSVRAAFRRAITEFQPDLVFAPWAYPDGWAAVSLGRSANLPTVIKVHGSDVLRMDEIPGRRQRTIDALRHADGIVAVSRDLGQRVSAFGVDFRHVQVVYDGIDSSLFHPGSQEEARIQLGLDQQEPLMIFVGNLVPVKGLPVLLEACTRLMLQGTRFRCCLIGDGPLRNSLQQEITQRQLQGRVELLGSCPHQQLPAWYRAADVVVLPSYSEGVPCVLLEAAACGTPFVASRVGGIPEIAHMGDSQLVMPGDPAALACAVAGFLPRSPRPSQPATSGSRSHEEAALELGDFLAQVLERHRHRHCRSTLVDLALDY
jgi:glycosyltransferase involved in cell wall biosynthesis